MSRKSHGAQRRRDRMMISAVENLECRVLFNTTPVVLSNNGATGLSQDWSDTTLFTAGSNNNWGNVPGITGYQGQDTTLSSNITGALNDPTSTQFQADWENNVNVAVPAAYTQAGALNANTLTTGELGYFTGTNVADAAHTAGDNVVAFQGSATADYPNMLLYLDSSSVTGAVNISFNARDIDGSADNTNQQINTQYRIGNSGPFTNIPGGYIADASSGPNLATLVTAVNATLPQAASGQSLLEIRVMTANASGSDEWIGIDDINVHAVTAPGALAFGTANYSVQENGGNAQLTVTRTGGLSGAVSVLYSTSDGPAAGNVGVANAGSDYTGQTNQIVNFAEGQSTATINIPIVDDSINETAENFTVTLSSPGGGATLGTQQSATVTIYDNDPETPFPSGLRLNELDVNPPGSLDGNNEWVEIINTSSSSQSLNDIYFLSIEGDVLSNDGNVTYSGNFGAGNTLAPGQIAIIESDTNGPTAPVGAVVIKDPNLDAANFPSGSLQNGTNSFGLVYSQTPINTGTDLDPTNGGTLTFPASIPAASILDMVGWHDNVPADVTSNGGIGIVYGSAVLDIPGNGTNGITGAATRIPGDNAANASSQWYWGQLFSATADPTSLTYDPANSGGTFPAGAVLTPGAANYFNTITSGQIGFSTSTNYTNESISNQGTDSSSVTLTINRTSGSSDNVTVNFTVNPGTASQGLDYGSPTITSSGGFTQAGGAYTGTITFAAGQTSATIAVPIYNDSIPEPTEAFTVTLGNYQNASGHSSNVPLPGITSTAVNIGDNDTKLLLTEILANVPSQLNDTTGSDTFNEFVEISGTPGQVIPANTYFVSVEGDATAGTPTNAGNLTYVIDLGGTVVGSNGLIEIRSENPASLLPPPAPGTTVVNGDSFDAMNNPTGFNQSGGILQNGTNSFLLMNSAEVPSAAATLPAGTYGDVDTNNDGTLDLSTFGANLIDGVGWTDGGSGDIAYGTNLNSGGFKVTQNLGSGTASAEIAPAAAVRSVNTTDVPDLDPNSTASLTAASDWYYGSLLGQDSASPATDDRLVFDPAHSGQFNWVNQTADGADLHEHLTPGELNYNTAPFVELPTSGFAGGTTNPILNIDWSSNVSQNISTSQITLTNTDTSTPVTGFTLNAETAAQAFANGYVDALNLPTTLAQGHYKMTIAAGVTDDFTLQSTTSYTINFTVLYGDANGDGKVNALDFNALASHYGTSGNYSQGDFDYSGVIGSNDFAILAANYNQTIPAPTLTSPAAVAEALPASASQSPLAMASDPMSLFSNDPIAGSLLSDLL